MVSNMTIDWSISIGNLITIALMILGGLGAYYQLKYDVRMLRHDFNGLQKAMDLLSTTSENMVRLLTNVAVQDERLNSLDARIQRNEKDFDDLRRGDGWIINPTRGHPPVSGGGRGT